MYKYSIMQDREFYQSKLVLEGKAKSSPARKREEAKCGKLTGEYFGQQKLSAIPVQYM